MPMKIRKIREYISAVIIPLCFFTISSTFASPSMWTSDDEITANIQQKNLHDPLLRNIDIKISTQNGIVTLNGNVDDENQVEEAVKNAKSVRGVKNVNSFITSVTPDCVITTNVRRAIDKTKFLNGQSIQISTKDGVVLLGGIVATQEQADTALRIAKAVDGVVDVNSEIAMTNIDPGYSSKH
jgi:hyperosmotically inducible protein